MVDINFKEMEFVMIWDSCNYEKKVSVMDLNEVKAFVNTDNGFESSEIDSILVLKTGGTFHSADGFQVVRL
jgi:hypothetical protein